MAAALLVTEAAGGGEHFPALDVVRRGFGLRQRICSLLGQRGGRQKWPDDGRNNQQRYSHSSIRINRKNGNALNGRGGKALTARAARRSIPAARATIIV
jgi:hypothetical protein